MKWFKRFLRLYQMFVLFIVSIVSIDMLVLGGKLKLLWIASGNTTSASPFSTDGQSNYCLIIVGIATIFVAWYILNLFGKVESDDEDIKVKEK